MKLSDYLAREGLSKDAFAARVGCTPEAVRLWCKGERRPRAETALAIESATGGAVTWSDFGPTSEAA